MSEMKRRDFLKIAGAGSAVLAAIGAGVVATGKVFRADPISTDANEALAFRATAGLPQQPYPAYASLVFDGAVDPSAGTGTIRRAVYAGAPEAMSTIVFPGTERSYDVTRVTGGSEQMLVWARIRDGFTLEPGEPSTIRVHVDQRTGEVEAPFANAQLKLSGN